VFFGDAEQFINLCQHVRFGVFWLFLSLLVAAVNSLSTLFGIHEWTACANKLCCQVFGVLVVSARFRELGRIFVLG